MTTDKIYIPTGEVDTDSLPALDKSFKDAFKDSTFDTGNELKLGDRIIGEIRYGISIASFMQSRKSILSQGLVIASSEVLLTIILLSILAYMLTRHIKLLLAGTRNIAGGDYSIDLEVHGSDEIAQLTRDFNKMASAVNENIQALKESEEKYRQLVATSTDSKSPGLSIKDSNLLKLPPEGFRL